MGSEGQIKEEPSLVRGNFQNIYLNTKDNESTALPFTGRPQNMSEGKIFIEKA